MAITTSIPKPRPEPRRPASDTPAAKRSAEKSPKAGSSRPLSRDEIDAFGRELDALRDEVRGGLGERDVVHIRKMIRFVRYCETGGRLALHFGIDPLSFVAGTTALALSKIFENMEVGHNVMHGQYDWTRDPELDSRTYEWDTACTGDDWRHSHNYEHHTFTNILGRDRDVGYAFLRVSPLAPRSPRAAGGRRRPRLPLPMGGRYARSPRQRDHRR
jgi:fatty acid desaturase